MKEEVKKGRSGSAAFAFAFAFTVIVKVMFASVARVK